MTITVVEEDVAVPENVDSGTYRIGDLMIVTQTEVTYTNWPFNYEEQTFEIWNDAGVRIADPQNVSPATGTVRTTDQFGEELINLAPNGSGGFYLYYHLISPGEPHGNGNDYLGIRQFDAAGNEIGTALELPQNLTYGLAADGSTATGLADGSLATVVNYPGTSRYDLNVIATDGTFEQVRMNFTLTGWSNSPGDVAIVESGANLVVVHQDYISGGVYLRTVDRATMTESAEVRLDTGVGASNGETNAFFIDGLGYDTLADGRIVIAYAVESDTDTNADGFSTFFTILNADGTVDVAPVQVNEDRTLGSQTFPRVHALEDGTFVITNDTLNYVFTAEYEQTGLIRHFAADGTPLSGTQALLDQGQNAGSSHVFENGFGYLLDGTAGNVTVQVELNGGGGGPDDPPGPFGETDGNDTITGTIGADVIDARGGNDTIEGLSGPDVIDGGADTDTAILNGLAGAGFAILSYDGTVYSVETASGVYDTMTNVEFFQAEGVTIEAADVAAFDPLAYLASHDDLARILGSDAGVGLTHYLTAGHSEGREVSFDAEQYLENWSDLATFFGSDAAAATVHFVLAGVNEGRLAEDPLEYIASFPDLIAAFGGNDEATLTSLGLQHYMGAGQAEGRRAGIDFDVEQYLENWSDLASAFGSDEDAAIVHFINAGFAEGRLASDPLEYIASNPDLTAAFGGLDIGSMLGAGLAHWQSNGRNEGRSTDTFDVDTYLSNYADLRAAFVQEDGSFDLEGATLHFIRSGFDEGRTDDGILT